MPGKEVELPFRLTRKAKSGGSHRKEIGKELEESVRELTSIQVCFGVKNPATQNLAGTDSELQQVP